MFAKVILHYYILIKCSWCIQLVYKYAATSLAQSLAIAYVMVQCAMSTSRQVKLDYNNKKKD